MKYKDSPIGKVPENWNVSLFTDVIERVIDYRGKTPEKSQAGVLLITAKNVKKGYIQSEPREYIQEIDYDGWMTRGFPEIDDVLLTSEAPMGNVALLKVKRVALAQRLLTLRGKSNSLYNPYLMYYLLSDIGQNELSQRTGGSTVDGIKSSELKKIFIVCPPFVEQKKIAEILTSVDRVIELTSMEINKLKDLKEGIMQELLTKGIGHTKFKDSPVGRIPESWECVELQTLADKISDGLHSTPKYVESSEYFFVNGNNLKEGNIQLSAGTKHVSLDEYNQHKKDLSDNTILMSINGTIGSLAFYKGEKIVLGKSAAYVNLKSEVNIDFMYYILLSEKTQRYFVSELTGTTIMNLSLRSIKSTPVVLPSKEEQAKISKVLKALDFDLLNLNSKFNALDSLKKGLMNDLLTGKVRVK